MKQKLHDAIENLHVCLEDVIMELDEKDSFISLSELEDAWNEFYELAEKESEKREG